MDTTCVQGPPTHVPLLEMTPFLLFTQTSYVFFPSYIKINLIHIYIFLNFSQLILFSLIFVKDYCFFFFLIRLIILSIENNKLKYINNSVCFYFAVTKDIRQIKIYFYIIFFKIYVMLCLYNHFGYEKNIESWFVYEI